MSRLYDRIMENGILDPARSPGFGRYILTGMRGTTVIAAENVAEYYFLCKGPKPAWLIEDFPNVAPPFPNFFVEWKLGHTWANDAVRALGSATGIFFVAYDLEAPRLDVPPPYRDGVDVAGRPFGSGARWVVQIYTLLELTDHRIIVPLAGEFAVDGEGRIGRPYGLAGHQWLLPRSARRREPELPRSLLSALAPIRPSEVT